MTDSRRPRILVVDDELLNRRLIQAILAPEGYDIAHAADGADALGILAAGDVDLVLLDVMMPGIDGIEVCRQVRACYGQSVPVVMISALTDAGSRTRAKAIGADDFLTKPIHEDELIVRVRNLLLLRESYANAERLRACAEQNARAWHLVSSVASSLAGCLDSQRVTDEVFHHLADELGVEVITYFEHREVGLELTAMRSNAPADERAREIWNTVSSEASSVTSVSRLAQCRPLDELCSARGSIELAIVPVVRDGERLGAFCIGRYKRLADEELELVGRLSEHFANAIATVRSHARTVSRIKRHETAREEAERALRTSEERHRMLFDASPLPIWVFDPKTLRIVAVNDELVRLLGYTRGQLLEMVIPELDSPADAEGFVTEVTAARPGRTLHVGMRRYHRKDRSFVELDITCHATLLDGELTILAVGIDVTQSRRLEEQLRQSQKMDAIGQLAGGVAHDFNNILAAILGCADLALEELGDDHPVAPDLQEIEKAAQRAAALTRQLLAFSRQQRREVEVIALNSVVANVEKMLARVVGEDIEMSAILAPRLGSVESDAGQLEQVLMNLVVNARDAMPRGGRLTIETMNDEVDETLARRLGVTSGGYVVLAVSDTGCGMDSATQARVFEPFFTTKEVGKGTGLGLSTVFGIVKQSNGAISIYSEVGVGSTFRVYLPRISRAPAAVPTIPHLPVARSAGHRVLLVEDDDALRTVLRRQLTAWGYQLVEARNGAAALELLGGMTEPLDLLLTDLVMPGIDGRALATKVLAGRPGVKVLFMSGYTAHAAVRTVALTATDQFIEKPFTSNGLSEALRRTLGA